MARRQRIRFFVDLTAEEYLPYYQGIARYIVVRAVDGRRVRLPARNLRPFLTQEGIMGFFEMELDEDNKLLSIRQLED